MKDCKTIEVIAVSYQGNIREFFCRDIVRAISIMMFWECAGAKVLRATYVKR